MSATPVEQPGQDKDLRVGGADVAEAAQARLDHERVAVLSTAVGLARLRLLDGDARGAAEALDDAAEKSTRLFNEAVCALSTPTALQQSAPDVALVARLEAAERERDEALGVRAGFVSPVQKVLEERARAEGAEGEGARLRRALEAIARLQYRAGDYMVTAGTFDVAIQTAKSALAQSEGLPS